MKNKEDYSNGKKSGTIDSNMFLDIVSDYSYNPDELQLKQLWHKTDEELKEVQCFRATVKTVKLFNNEGKQMNIIF